MTTDKVRDISKNFRYLCEAITRKGKEAQMRVGAHIYEATNQKYNSVATYHADQSIPEDEKFDQYKLLFNILTSKTPDWSKLLGKTHNGAATAEEVPVQEVKPARKRFEPKAESPFPTEHRHHTDPKPEPEISSDASADPLTALIIKLVSKHIKVASGTDEKRVEEIARGIVSEFETDFNAGFSARLEKAMQNGAFPIDRVEEVVNKAVEKFEQSMVQRVVLCKLDGSTKEIDGRQHYKFPLLLACLSQRLNVALVGPAGSSKTTTAHNAAKALELAFEAISVGPMTSKADLLGFTDAHGKYHGTATVRRAVEGGIMLWDEFDAANASVATYGNMLLANDEFGTAEGMKVKHKDFCLIAGLNTYGMGANRVYVGRNQLDGATLDRFVVIDWDYDEGLEAHIVGCKRASPKLKMDAGDIMEADDWLKYVHNVRQACEKLAIRHVFSPRASIHGCKLFLAGVGRTHVESMVLWKGLETATVSKIKAAL
jgi:cobaltochelatase CobS